MTVQAGHSAIENTDPHTTTDSASSALTARLPNPARAMPERTRRRQHGDLPLSHRCGAQWSGSATAHCGACCVTFAGTGPFDRHRRNGTCLDPTTVGMTLLAGRAYPVWGIPEATNE